MNNNRMLSWALSAALVGAAPVGAATLTVTAAGDAPGACPGANCTLRAALVAAQAGDVIDFDPALGLPLTITLAGELVVSATDVIVFGPGPALLELQPASGRVLDLAAGKLTLDGLTVANGLLAGSNGTNASPGSGAAGGPGGAARGGCINVRSGAQLVLHRVAVRNCQALGGDGGSGGSGASATGLGNNGGNGGPGAPGGNAEGGAIAVAGRLDLIGSSVSGSFARSGRGGHGGAGGSASGGSGGNGGPGSFAGAARGAGVLVASGGTLLLRNSTVTGNELLARPGGNGGSGGAGLGGQAAGGAGGVGGSADGGALSVSSGASVAADIEFSTLGPTAMSVGPGGLGGSGSPIGMAGAAGSKRGEALAVGAAAQVRLRSAVATGTDAASDCDGPLVAVGNNFGSSAQCGFSHEGDHAATFAAAADADGRMRLRPLAGSVVIDAAADCLDLDGAAVATDQDGRWRPVDGDGIGGAQCDLGAIEYSTAIFRDGFE